MWGTAEREYISKLIRDVPDFPQPGVAFKDIAPLLADPVAFELVVSELAILANSMAKAQPITKVIGMEARGFILGAPVALALGCGFVPARKAGKLPGATVATSYALEYGEATIELQQDALSPDDRVILVDDVLATGGTAAAVVDLVASLGAEVIGLAVLLELCFLAGREQLNPVLVTSLLSI